MTKLEKVLYTAKAHTTGGRDDGASRTGDGRLQVTLSRPGTSAGHPDNKTDVCVTSIRFE
jgi:lipoyl-dependent peroxiredoxin